MNVCHYCASDCSGKFCSASCRSRSLQEPAALSNSTERPLPRVAKAVTKLVIDRRRWFRGKVGSALLRTDGKMCCLGFFGRKLGYKPSELLWLLSPEDLSSKETMQLAKLVTKEGFGDTPICKRLMSINDTNSLTESKRESKLTTLFKRIGVAVRFVN